MSTSGFSQNYFWIRRLHSLSGVLPIGAFVLVHLFTNAYSWSPAAFNEHVKNDDRVVSVMLTVRDGMTLVRRRSE